MYCAEIDLWDPETCTRYRDVAHFMLVYEVLDMVVRDNDRDYTQLDPLSPLFNERRDLGVRENVDTSDMSALQLWGDSAPFNDAGDSLYTLLWEVLSSTDNTRHPIVAFPKTRVCDCGCKGRHTFDSIMVVVVWMFRALFAGLCPWYRHDGVAFEDSPYKTDKPRAKRARRKQKFPKGCAIKKKGDWT